jgi:hypothetical protein
MTSRVSWDAVTANDIKTRHSLANIACQRA